MKKLLYVASTSNHLLTFHLPYIERLKEDYEVKIMAKDDNENFADYDIDFRKRILSFKHFKIIKKIEKILKNENFDFIILNTSLASFLVRCAIKRLKNRPIVVNIVHGYFFSRHTNLFMNFFYKLAEKSVRKQTDYILTMNQEDYDLAKKYKLYSKDIYMIDGMGIDEDRFSGKLNIKKFMAIQNPKFLFIGELSKRKNQKFLIKFIQRLNKYKIYATLRLVGEGDFRRSLTKYIKKCNIEKQVEIVGFDKNIKKYLDETDYYICASGIEGMPFNILEAMYSGCIILSSDIKGSVDVIKDYNTGILYKYNNLADLITKFRLLNNSIRLKELLSQNAHNEAKKYLLKNVFDDNIKIIKGILNANGK